MSNINPSNSSKSIAKIILILVGIAAIWFLVSLVNNNINNTLNPLQLMNHELGTQVANLLHPTPTIIPDPVTIINEVQSLARLETIRYNVEKVITAETGQEREDLGGTAIIAEHTELGITDDDVRASTSRRTSINKDFRSLQDFGSL